MSDTAIGITEAWDAAERDCNIEKLVDLVTPDYVRVLHDRELHGTKDLRKYLGETFWTFAILSAQSTNETIVENKDGTVTVQGSWKGKLRYKATGMTFEADGKWTDSRRLCDDGKWRIYHAVTEF